MVAEADKSTRTEIIKTQRIFFVSLSVYVITIILNNLIKFFLSFEILVDEYCVVYHLL